MQVFCRTALLKTSRTHSGGLALNAIQAAVDLSQCMLIPQPDSTPPVAITFHVGCTEPVDGFGWGLTAQIVCQFAYLLRDREVTEVDTSIKLADDCQMVVSYADKVLFDVRLLHNEVSNVEHLLNNSKLTGWVDIVKQ